VRYALDLVMARQQPQPRPTPPPTGEEATHLASPEMRAAAAAAAAAAAKSGTGPKRCPNCRAEFPSDFMVCPRDATPLIGVRDGDDPLFGVVLGGTYRLTRILGSGAMGQVYEAEHMRLDRKFAVKVINDVYAKNADAVARFEREARALGRIQSEHVLEVVDVLQTPDARPCMVAEVLSGEDLQERLDREGALSPSVAVPIVRQVLRGLAAAHAHGVIHRDLKPSNIYLTAREGQATIVKILDFGVAKLADDSELTRTGAVVGTPAYMAPEQARSSAQVDVRADVYAVGAVLYRMVTGTPPYGGTDPINTLSLLLENDPPRPTTINSAIPHGLEAVIQRAMARDPGTRPSTALELERELAAFDVSGEPLLGPMTMREGGRGPGTLGSSLLYHRTGTSASADQITRRAKRARPIATVSVGGSVLAAWFGVGALLAGLILAMGQATGLTSTERVMSLAGATIAAAVVLLALVRKMQKKWRSAPSVEEFGRRTGLALLVGLTTYGALELATRAWSFMLSVQLEHHPLADAARVAVAAVVAVCVAFFLKKR